MAEIQSLPNEDILDLINGISEYVELTGYYENLKYDRPIPYYILETTLPGNGFSVVDLENSNDYKLVHDFYDTIDLKYCGIRGNDTEDEVANINAALVKIKTLNVRNVIISGINNVNPGHEISLQSDTHYFLHGTIISTPPKENDPINIFCKHDSNPGPEICYNNNYQLISFEGTRNTKLIGGRIIGNKDWYRTPNENELSYYQLWEAKKDYQINEYVFVNTIPLKVVESGKSGNEKPNISNINPGSIVIDGTNGLEFEVQYTDFIEGGMGIYVYNAENFQIENVDISNCWADGIYVRESYKGNILNVDCHHNRRQGISVIDCDGLNITNSRFNDTRGTIPESGIDIEPNSGEWAQNINIINCECERNEGYGCLITTPDNTAFVNDINVINLTVRNNILDGFACKTKNGYFDTVYNVNVNNILSYGNHASQILIEGTNGVKFTKGRLESEFNNPIFNVYRAKNLHITEMDMVGRGSENGIMVKEIENVQISGNNIESKGNCIADDQGVYMKKNVIIKNNTLVSEEQCCIDLSVHDSLNINNNIIRSAAKDGIRLNDIVRTIITENRINNVGLKDDDEYAHIRITGETAVCEIICENNILKNDPALSLMPTGIRALSPLLTYSVFSTLHSHIDSSFGLDMITVHSSVKVQDIR